MTNALIAASQVQISENVAIASVPLANAFLKDQNNTLVRLGAELAPISIDDVHLDDEGRVVINNSAFRAAISGREELDRVSNGACGLNIVC